MNVVLLGYRGSGKSTVGSLLARRLGWAFVDTDEQIAANAGASIRDIFARQGEAEFRRLEEAAVARAARRERCVIALGGGALMTPANRAALAGRARFVWLRAGADTLWRRMCADPRTADARPDLTDAGGCEEVAALLAQREAVYRDAAELTIDTESASPDEIAARIEAWLSGPDAAG